MANGGNSGSVHVLRMDAIRSAIDALTADRVHPFFIAYLHIRAKGVEAGASEGISPRCELVSGAVGTGSDSSLCTADRGCVNSLCSGP